MQCGGKAVEVLSFLYFSGIIEAQYMVLYAFMNIENLAAMDKTDLPPK